jgi:hypothetical protein
MTNRPTEFDPMPFCRRAAESALLSAPHEGWDILTDAGPIEAMDRMIERFQQAKSVMLDALKAAGRAER